MPNMATLYHSEADLVWRSFGHRVTDVGGAGRTLVAFSRARGREEALARPGPPMLQLGDEFRSSARLA
jgi:hypothetical protein